MDNKHLILVKLDDVNLSTIIQMILGGKQVFLSEDRELTYFHDEGFVVINSSGVNKVNISDYISRDFYIKEKWYNRLPLDKVFLRSFFVISSNNDLFLVHRAKTNSNSTGVILIDVRDHQVSADEYRPATKEELNVFIFNIREHNIQDIICEGRNNG